MSSTRTLHATCIYSSFTKNSDYFRVLSSTCGQDYVIVSPADYNKQKQFEAADNN